MPLHIVHYSSNILIDYCNFKYNGGKAEEVFKSAIKPIEDRVYAWIAQS